MTFTSEQTDLLKAPLNMANVKPPKQYGPKGDYIEGWHAMAEANRIFGFDGWNYEIVKNDCVNQAPREIGKDKKPGFGVTYVSTVRVTVQGVIREDVGSGHGYDLDCGLAHESAIKEAVTDALKRALRSFGNQFGLALYDKERANVTSEPLNAPVIQTNPIMVKTAKDTVAQQPDDPTARKWWADNRPGLTDILNNDELNEVFDAVKARIASFKKEAA